MVDRQDHEGAQVSLRLPFPLAVLAPPARARAAASANSRTLASAVMGKIGSASSPAVLQSQGSVCVAPTFPSSLTRSQNLVFASPPASIASGRG